MAWGVDPMDRSKPIDIPPFLGRHSAGPLEGCAEEGLKAWQPTLLCAAKSFCKFSPSLELGGRLTLYKN